ncbi:MAG: pyridoxal-phosphate dependent enzyme [Gammaproteobacteria bacterium]|nr:pyridoxal-phosphate dependent enzyme [Gammaproteobacteria bacterium]
MKPLHIHTPLLQSQLLTRSLNKAIYLKMEALQPCGSFKLRGIGKLCQQEKERGSRAFVASSGGNAGIAAAYCGMKLNVPTTVFIPETSHPLYVDRIKSYGAEVIIAGENWGKAHQAATLFVQTHTASYIHPFDHPILWEGHSSMIDEVAQEGLKPDVVLVSVGGGGLACGVLEGMHRHKWHDVPLVAVETQGADSFAQSLKENRCVTLPRITSKATSLGATYVTQKLMDWSRKHVIHSVVVSDEEAEQATYDLAKDQRVLVELASGASLSLVYHSHPIIAPFKSILVIVCGGVNISHFQLKTPCT